MLAVGDGGGCREAELGIPGAGLDVGFPELRAAVGRPVTDDAMLMVDPLMPGLAAGLADRGSQENPLAPDDRAGVAEIGSDFPEHVCLRLAVPGERQVGFVGMPGPL